MREPDRFCHTNDLFEMASHVVNYCLIYPTRGLFQVAAGAEWDGMRSEYPQNFICLELYNKLSIVLY